MKVGFTREREGMGGWWARGNNNTEVQQKFYLPPSQCHLRSFVTCSMLQQLFVDLSSRENLALRARHSCGVLLRLL